MIPADDPAHDDIYATNPALDLDPAWRSIFQLYATARPLPAMLPLPVMPGAPPAMLPVPSPPGPLPEAGGQLAQGAWLMDVFGLMQAEDFRLLRVAR